MNIKCKQILHFGGAIGTKVCGEPASKLFNGENAYPVCERCSRWCNPKFLKPLSGEAFKL